MMMRIVKSFVFLTISTFALGGFSQTSELSVTCNETRCVGEGAQTQEKAAYSAVQIVNSGSSSQNISITPELNKSSRNVHAEIKNGSFEDAKNLSVNLSSTVLNKAAPEFILIGDNFDQLQIKLNGYSGSNGRSAAEICAANIKGNKYGTDAKNYFLQRRSVQNSGLSLDKCDDTDVSYLSQTQFSCQDSSYREVSNSNPLAIQRLQQVSRCGTTIPQQLCVRKMYKVTCNYELFIKDPGASGYTSGFNARKFSDGNFAWDYFYKRVLGGGTQKVFDTGSTCNGWFVSQRLSYQANAPYFSENNLYNGLDYIKYNNSGSDAYNFQLRRQKDFFFSQPELDYFYSLSAAGRADYSGNSTYNNLDICQHLVDGRLGQLNGQPVSYGARDSIPQTLEIHSSTYDGGHSCSEGWCDCECECQMRNRDIKTYRQDAGNLDWRVSSASQIAITGDGLDGTGLRLKNGSNLTTGTGKVAFEQTNPDNWKLQIMKGFESQCNEGYSYHTTQMTNFIKYNPAQNSCAAVSSCVSGNSSSSNVTGCQIDPNNLSTYYFLGMEADPERSTEFLDCSYASGCHQRTGGSYISINNKLLEFNSQLDSITPEQGQNASAQGRGLAFIYDAKNLSIESKSGDAGVGGNLDLTPSLEIKYCASFRDFTTDTGSPTNFTKYEVDPEITYKRFNWKVFNFTGGGLPGTPAPYKEGNGVEVFKKLDPSVRYYLKKGLL